MVAYPDWLTALDRTRIDQAMAGAEAPYLVVGDVVAGRRYASEAAAIQAVLTVFEAVVDVLSTYRTRRRAEDLQAVAHDLFDQLIVWVDVRRPLEASRPLHEFANAVRTARDAQPWWLQLLNPRLLAYPDWLTALDRTRIDQAMAGAEAPHLVVGDVVAERRYASEAAAIQAALAVFEVVVDVLSTHRTRRPAKDLLSAAHDQLDQLIVWADVYRPLEASRPLREFANAVWAARDAQPRWLQFLNSITAVTSHQVLVKRPRRPLSRQAAWLAHEMELAGHLTPHRLQQLGGPDSKTIRQLLDGHGTNRDDVLRKVVHGLNEANHQQGRKVTFALLDIPRD